MKIKTFIDEEFKQFSIYDNVRSIPSIADGLKNAQRKAVYALMKHGQNEIKVAQLAAYAAQITAYAHGEVSMAETIVGLAQDFPGSNNINMFEPIGQFGSILSSNAASVRYIYTRPSPYLYDIFKRADECILDYQNDDGVPIEPVNFFPILPLCLINGSRGIGTGHATNIYSRDPKEIKRAILKILKGKKITEDFIPYFGEFGGTIEPRIEDEGYKITGAISKTGLTELTITALPIDTNIDKYKKHLIKLLDERVILDFENESSEEDGFKFIIRANKTTVNMRLSRLLLTFKLTSRIKDNLTLWDRNTVLKRFDSVEEILREFTALRLDVYEARRLTQIQLHTDELDFLKAKLKFVLGCIKDNPFQYKETQFNKWMLDLKINPDYYDRLLSMAIRSLTEKLVKNLREQVKKCQEDIKVLKDTTNVEMYTTELTELKL